MKKPDRLFIGKEDVDTYKNISNESFFRNKSNKELFMIALAYGIKCDLKIELQEREEYVRREYLKQDDWAILHSIAFQELGLEELTNIGEIFNIAEQYAHGGIKLLKERLDSIHGSADKEFEVEIRDLYKELQKE